MLELKLITANSQINAIKLRVCGRTVLLFSTFYSVNLKSKPVFLCFF